MSTTQPSRDPRTLTPWQRRMVASGFAEYQSNNADRWKAGSTMSMGKPKAAHDPPLSAEEAAAIGQRFVEGTESALDREAAVLLFSLPLTCMDMTSAQEDRLLAALDPTAVMEKLPEERSAIAKLRRLMARIRTREAQPRVSQDEALERIAAAFHKAVPGVEHAIDKSGAGMVVDFIDRELDIRLGAVELKPQGGDGREAIANFRMEDGAPEDEQLAHALKGVIVLPRKPPKKRSAGKPSSAAAQPPRQAARAGSVREPRAPAPDAAAVAAMFAD